jgi:hypothetical protein
LIADLVLGRRQFPLLDLPSSSIEEASGILTSRNEQDPIHARIATFSFVVENLSLATAEDVKIGVVSWSLSNGEAADISRHLRSYLDISDINIPNSLDVPFQLIHRSSLASGKRFTLDPFQIRTIRDLGPFYYHRQISVRVLGAVYVISKGAPPTWFQLEFGNLPGGIPIRSISKHFQPTLISKGSERPQVAWFPE